MPEWLSFLLADTSALQLVFWFVAIGALVAVIVKLWPALSQFVTIMNAVTGLPDYITRADERTERLEQKVDGIYHETHKNDGSSVKDAVDRIEVGVAGLHTKVEELAASDEELRAADAELRTDLENTRPHPPKEIS